MDQVFRQGIARKLMQMVQFVSWVKVKNISMHLCATSTSLQFYESMKFQKYGSEFLNLPIEIQNALQVENITEVGDEVELYQFLLTNNLL